VCKMLTDALYGEDDCNAVRLSVGMLTRQCR